MKKFTPEYRGVVQVRFEESPDGYMTVAAYPPKSFRYQVSSKKKPNKSRRIRLKNSGSIEIEIESELDDIFVEEEQTAVAGAALPPPASAASSSKSVKPHNPWALKCHQRQLSKLRRSATQKDKESHCQKFMLLENITWRFEYPCILDLKMGTRQYADDATPAKIESQSAKAAMSTSVQLGVRICGMQIYQVTTGKFVCRNKYYGRKLDVDGFKEGICQFLHNGRRLRTDALLPLIEKLQELKAVLATLDTYRFYTSSLLLAYEGLDPEYCGDDELSMITDDDSSNDSTTMDSTTSNGIHIIHGFQEIKSPTSILGMMPSAKSADSIITRGQSLDESSLPSSSTSSTPPSARRHHTLRDEDDDDCAMDTSDIDAASEETSSNNASTSTASHATNCRMVGSVSSDAVSNMSSSSIAGTPLNQQQVSSGSSNTLRSGGSGSSTSAASLNSESVDVRMIDFAHSLHDGMGYYGKEHVGPDTGYIFGLQNLIKVLQEICDEQCFADNTDADL
ncbi:unnamed protein product [Orchesella dallaii]